MEKKKFDAEAYYEAPACKCGGCYTERVGAVVFVTDPVRAEFKCRQCGDIKIFFEPDWPGVKFKIHFPNQVNEADPDTAASPKTFVKRQRR